MERSDLTDELERAEGLMLQGQPEQAADLLARLAEDAEEYVDKNCPTTEEVQPKMRFARVFSPQARGQQPVKAKIIMFQKNLIPSRLSH